MGGAAAAGHRGSDRLRAGIALLLAVAVLALLVAVQMSEGRHVGERYGRFLQLRLIEAWWVLTIVGTLLLVRAAPRRVVLLVLAVGAFVLPLLGLGRGPQISDDLYRYAWDGRVQAAGIDPYRYTPVSPSLERLRDDWLFPDRAACVVPPTTPACTRINYRNARTIYPPVGEAWFALVHYLPGSERERHLQLWADVASLGLVGLLAAALSRAGRSPAWAALYAWSPLAGIDVASDAHVDVVAALLTVAGLVVATHRGTRARGALLAGALLGGAVSVKLYPALALPAAVRRHPARVLLAAAAVFLIGYLPHVLAVGPDVVGFLPQYLSVEGYSSGGRFLLLGAVGLTGTAAKATAALLLVATVLGCWRSRAEPARAALWLFGVALLVATPVQPWYFVTLVALAALEARWEWATVALAAYPLYVQPDDPLKTLVGTRSFALALAVVVVATATRWARGRRQRSSSSLNSASSSRSQISDTVG